MRMASGVWLGVALAAWAVPTWADPGQTTWTTYLYQGPSTRFAVIDELQQSTMVNVLACDRTWCEIEVGGRLGYLQHEVVSSGNAAAPRSGLLPQPAVSLKASPSGPCFEAMQTGGNGGKMPTVFCENPE